MTISYDVPLKVVITRWTVSFAIVAGFLLYHSKAPWLTVVLAGLGTLLLALVSYWWKNRRSSSGAR